MFLAKTAVYQNAGGKRLSGNRTREGSPVWFTTKTCLYHLFYIPGLACFSGLTSKILYQAGFHPRFPVSSDLARKMMAFCQEVNMTITKKIISCLVFLSFIMVLIGTVAVSAQQPQPATKNLININTADARQLESLPRIGPKMAVRILDYRKANGNFKRVQDLMKVKGVGPKIFEKLQSLITV
jgi:comEA protein